MKNLPTQFRPSIKILQDLILVRKKLVAIENSKEPFVDKLDPLLKRDEQLSECLVQYLIYELGLNLKERIKE